tara:strand:- start:3589 stop:3774 length:186 start_codon:yes stop_codon:yes gene_type:complete
MSDHLSWTYSLPVAMERSRWNSWNCSTSYSWMTEKAVLSRDCLNHVSHCWQSQLQKNDYDG